VLAAQCSLLARCALALSRRLKQETEKYRGQDKGAASQRKRLIRDLQERTVDVEAKTAQYEDAYKVCGRAALCWRVWL
jgi:hypothetical protein